MNVAVLSFFFLIPLFLLATSFTRIFIVLSFLKKSLGDLGIPSGQILFGLALLFSLLVMREPMTAIYQNSLLPFLDSKISASEFLKKSETPLRSFMSSQVTEADLKFVRSYSKIKDEEKAKLKEILSEVSRNVDDSVVEDLMRWKREQL